MIKRTAVCAAFGLVFSALGCSGSNTSSSDAGGAGGAGSAGTGSAGKSSGSSGAASSSGGAFSSSVAGSEQLGKLSDSDAQKLCNDLEQYVSSAPVVAAESKFTCGISGLTAAYMATDKTDAAIQGACKTAYDACVADSSPMMADTCQKPDATCTATVAEYTACLNDAVKVLDTTDVPSCASLTADNLQTALLSLAGLSTAQPASCTAYQMKCPDSSMPNPGAM